MSKENELYERIISLQKEKTEIEARIKEFKEELENSIIPQRDAEVKIVFIPEYIDEAESYLIDRFPSYDIVSINEENRTATVKEKDEFIPKKMEFSDGGQAYRRISKGKPSIDVYQLQKGYPDIFCEIVSVYPEIDENKINKKLENDPEFISILEEIIKMSKPSVSMVVSKSRKNEE